MVWDVDSSATEEKLQEGVLAALQEAGAHFDTRELAVQEVVSTEVKRGRATNRMHGIVRLKTKVWLMYLQKANPLTDLRSVPSRT